MNSLLTIFVISLVALQGNIDARHLLELRGNATPGEVLDLSKTEIKEYTFSAPAHLGRSYFPEATLSQYIFFRAGYDRILLPQNLKYIDKGAFSSSDISTIEIPEGVTDIADFAFYGCTRLQSISLPSTLRNIGKGAFAGCTALKGIDLSGTQVTEIPDNCFADASSLAFLRLPAGIQSVGTEAFRNTAINQLLLPEVKTLAPYALSGMHELEQVVLNKDAHYNEGTLMNNSALTRVSGVPENVPALFAANCYTLSPSDHLGDAVEIGSFAFANTDTDVLVLAPSVLSIEKGAFAGINSLHTINADALLGDTPDVDPDAFSGLNPADITLHVSRDCEQPWRDHPVWGLFNITSADTVGVNDVTSDAYGRIVITILYDKLLINAPEPLTSAAIYATDGTLIADVLPYASAATASDAMASQIEYPLSSINERIIIVTAATTTDRTTLKILR